MMKNDAKQIDRFKEAAREAGANESDDALDRVMGKLNLKKSESVKATSRTDRQESSGTEN